MLGDEGDVAKESAHIQNFHLCSLMDKGLEKQFDDGGYVIVPVPREHVPAKPRYSELDDREPETKAEA